MDYFFIMQSLLCICFIVLLLYVYKSNFQPKPSNYKATNGALKSYPLIGNLPELIKNRDRFLYWTTEILSASPTNTIVLHLPGLPPKVITANPSNVKHFVKTNFERYRKGDEFRSIFQDVFGDSLFTLDGEAWKYQRKKLVQVFASNMSGGLFMDITEQETGTRLLPALERASTLNHVMDLQEIFECVMFDIACKTFFGEDPCALDSDGKVSSLYVEALNEASLNTIRRLYTYPPFVWKVMKFLNIGPEQTLKHSMSIIHDYFYRIIGPIIDMETRLSRKDLLSRFINITGITDESLIRYSAVGILLAGKDTVASGLTWFFWLLSMNPRVKKKILAELEEIRARHNKSLEEIYTSEELHEMHYLHAAITESLRLYPPAPYEWKNCTSDDVFPDGMHVKKGWMVMYNTYAMGRMEEIWGTDSLEYRPERWLKDGVFQQDSPFRYTVFHAGPRTCVGKDLAYIQMKIIAASMVERFEIEVQDNRVKPEMIASITLLMKDGLPVKVRKRFSESNH